MTTIVPLNKTKLINQLNLVAQPCKDAKLGNVLDDLITAHNALCAHLDAGNVTGIGNANVANYGVKVLGAR